MILAARNGIGFSCDSLLRRNPKPGVPAQRLSSTTKSHWVQSLS